MGEGGGVVKKKRARGKIFVVVRASKSIGERNRHSTAFFTTDFFVYHKVYHAVPPINQNGARLRSYIWLPRHQT